MIRLGEIFKKHKGIIFLACLMIICIVSALFLVQGKTDSVNNIKRSLTQTERNR